MQESFITPTSTSPLEDWLQYAERINEKPIELGLARMREMISRLGIHFDCPVFTVAGTNGKGSTCAMLEAILRKGGYRVGMHTSPHLVRFNERAVIDGKEATDASLSQAFARVEAVRKGLPLTYFEFTGLAILSLFSESHLDAVILEIGLGGRLDAMNAIDTDCGIVCALGIDHTAYLGLTREAIAAEKACIYRSGHPAILSDRDAPKSLVAYAEKIGAPLARYGLDFETAEHGDTFDFSFGKFSFLGLKKPALRGENQVQNAAGVLAALLSLAERLPITRTAIEEGLKSAYMPGRFEVFHLASLKDVPIYLDVGHNPQAASVLRENITQTARTGEKLFAVFAMLKDKDIATVARTMAPLIDHWFIAPLGGLRGADLAILTERLNKAQVENEKTTAFPSVDAALRAAIAASRQATERPVRILVFGSFVTVGAAVSSLRTLGASSEEDSRHAR